jgi:hypothetical protein
MEGDKERRKSKRCRNGPSSKTVQSNDVFKENLVLCLKQNKNYHLIRFRQSFKTASLHDPNLRLNH